MIIVSERLRKKILDCRALYLKYAGLEHDLIEREMRELGWRGFSKRSLYARTKRGRRTPGWPERYHWDEDLPTKGHEKTRRRVSEPGAVATGAFKRNRSKRGVVGAATGAFKRNRSKHGIAYANRRTFAREHTPAGDIAALKPRFNRQKARRLRKLSAGNAGAPAGMDAEASGRGTETHVRHAAGNGVTSEGACAPGNACAPGIDSFHSWLRSQPGVWDWDLRHQLYLYERLRRVTDGRCKRLMIFMPPRHGKSELVTVRYSAWRLKQDPSMNVILGSYNQRLADKFSRKIRKVLADDAAEELRNADCGSRIDGNDGYRPNPEPNSIQHGGTQRRPAGTNPQSAFRDPQSMFPFANRPINRVSEWETATGGGLRAVGVGSGVTGFGANLIVIDDPVKSREQANSACFREKIWDWFNDDLYTRLEPDGAIILIQTRWHEDDLAGRLLQEMANGGTKWEVVCLPALAEPGNAGAFAGNAGAPACMETHVRHAVGNGVTGEAACAPGGPRSTDPIGRQPGDALWPERYTREMFLEIKERLGSWSFSALYQQRPTPAEGGIFKREWFRNCIVAAAPKGLRWARGYDLALSTRSTADYTASFRCAFDKENNLYIADGFRKRIEVPDQRRFIMGRIQAELDTDHGVETANHGLGVIQQLMRETSFRGRRFRGIRVDGDKISRASTWSPIAEAGRIRLVQGPWIRDFIDEACSFPAAAHDDQIDAVSIAVSMLQEPSKKFFSFNMGDVTLPTAKAGRR